MLTIVFVYLLFGQPGVVDSRSPYRDVAIATLFPDWIEWTHTVSRRWQRISERSGLTDEDLYRMCAHHWLEFKYGSSPPPPRLLELVNASRTPHSAGGASDEGDMVIEDVSEATSVVDEGGSRGGARSISRDHQRVQTASVRRSVGGTPLDTIVEDDEDGSEGDHSGGTAELVAEESSEIQSPEDAEQVERDSERAAALLRSWVCEDTGVDEAELEGGAAPGAVKTKRVGTGGETIESEGWVKATVSCADTTTTSIVLTWTCSTDPPVREDGEVDSQEESGSDDSEQGEFAPVFLDMQLPDDPEDALVQRPREQDTSDEPSKAIMFRNVYVGTARTCVLSGLQPGTK